MYEWIFFLFLFFGIFSHSGENQLVVAFENYSDFTVKKEGKENNGSILVLSPNRNVTELLLFYLCNPSQLTALIFKDTLIHPDVV